MFMGFQSQNLNQGTAEKYSFHSCPFYSLTFPISKFLKLNFDLFSFLKNISKYEYSSISHFSNHKT